MLDSETGMKEATPEEVREAILALEDNEEAEDAHEIVVAEG
ncbi:hypothetical protein [Natronolimnobius baerhuensis]|nr:hypothetical protein [Natronolimnobius baerhuensis]